MMYGTKTLKNGRKKGELEFKTGKKVYLNVKENAEFNLWVNLRIRYYPKGNETDSEVETK